MLILLILWSLIRRLMLDMPHSAPTTATEHRLPFQDLWTKIPSNYPSNDMQKWMCISTSIDKWHYFRRLTDKHTHPSNWVSDHTPHSLARMSNTGEKKPKSDGCWSVLQLIRNDLISSAALHWCLLPHRDERREQIRVAMQQTGGWGSVMLRSKGDPEQWVAGHLDMKSWTGECASTSIHKTTINRARALDIGLLLY
jgi:hypothetical protein